jgi:hypothetical protein
VRTSGVNHLKLAGILKLTLKEHLRGQILWLGGFVGVILLMLVSLISGIALTHENRILDVFSYFINDQILLFIAIFMGSNLYSQDFNARGVAELLIPAGSSRQSILLVRMSAFFLILVAIGFFIFGLKSFLLPRLTEFPQEINHTAHACMLLLSVLKSTSALTVATFIGCLTRPVFAILATLTLYSVGHLTASFDSLLNSANSANSPENVSPFMTVLYQVFSFWNPNLLIMESVRGEWIIPDFSSLALSGLWAAGVILTATGLALAKVSRTDISS